MDRRNHVSGQTGVTGSNPVLISGRLFRFVPFGELNFKTLKIK